MSTLHRPDEPIVLPAPAAPARRGAIPIVAAFVPMVGAVAMWLLTGYVMMLCFAAIGPLMVLASLVDGARNRRKERRRAARELTAACAAAREELSERHSEERSQLDRLRPSTGRLAEARTLWRHGPIEVVLGLGRVRSDIRVTGGEGAEAEQLRRDAAWVTLAPVTVPLRKAGGVCVQGPPAAATAVARGLLMQLCLRAAPSELVVSHLLPGDEAALEQLPHLGTAAGRSTQGREGREPIRVVAVGLVHEDPAGAETATTIASARGRTASLESEGRPAAAEPPGTRDARRAAAIAEADFVIAVTESGADAPAACGVILELEPGAALRARRLDDTALDPEGEPLRVEALARAQAERLASVLAGRSDSSGGEVPLPEVRLGALLESASPHERSAEAAAAGGRGDRPHGPGLDAPIGRGADGTTSVDLVHDGPHAVVVGITGSGKSELLTTWIASLASRYDSERVAFLLADFKGGTAFTSLLALPHVTGMITDLDGAGSRRAVESLRAELRRRESVLAAAGATDIGDERVDMPRLVIVVDEFAALLQDHGDLHQVFTDVAARGRALGMHLVLGTQRSSGVLRDALLANCPLRISLRVAERADSSAVVGVDDAAYLPGDVASRGLALVRRGGDVAPERTRIARTEAELLARLASADAQRAQGAGAPGEPGHAPWLPPLPRELTLGELGAPEHGGGAVLLGLADEPDEQRQPVVTMHRGGGRGMAVIGGSASGKTNVVRLVAGQVPGAVVVPGDLEGAWDAVERAADDPPPLIAIDDLDSLLGRFPAEYAHEFAARAESLVREAGARGTTVVVAASRVTGPVERVIAGLGRRALLRLPSRADHVQAGGNGGDFDPRRPPGRAVMDEREVQFAGAAAQDEAVPDRRAAAGRTTEAGAVGTRAERRRALRGESLRPAGTAGRRPAPTLAHRSAGAAALWRPAVAVAVAAIVTNGAVARASLLAEAWGRAVRVVALDALESGASIDDLAAGAEHLVAVGDGESWLRHGALLRRIRSSGDVLVAAECRSELRSIAGERSLPPYAESRAGRAWLVSSSAPPLRVLLPV
ncbi:FtsK/SpoIIIE domain-containing protein [Microbacterium sp.]|uniref:FtsK/SpoIIIE domain-containing protein n=1 Tax=Microbacterium sp. TaxID=51671 RepID=UPI003F965117